MQRTAEALGAAATAVPGFERFVHGKLWIGMKGVVMPLHYDSTDNFYVPFFGRKKVVLVEPGHVEELGRFPNGHPLAGSARADVDLDVLDDLEIFETVIAPGDVLYLPANWWHQFVSAWNLEQTSRRWRLRAGSSSPSRTRAPSTSGRRPATRPRTRGSSYVSCGTGSSANL